MRSSLRRRRPAHLLVALLASVSLVGCGAGETAPEGQQEPDAAESAEPMEDTEPMGDTEPDAQPEVFFASIEEGGSYASPVEIVFEAENFDIVPVEDPPVVRPGEGHYHLAVDAECVVAGEIIPPGNPSYIHFGDGSDRISMQFEPGEHTLCLQMADGEHRVLAGPDASALTKQITITVTAEQ